MGVVSKLSGVRSACISVEGGKVSTSVLAPSMTSFMLMAFLPLSLPFFLFFFLNIHFLQTQKQHANTRMMATNAIETMAHDGTEKGEECWTEYLRARNGWSKQSNIGRLSVQGSSGNKGAMRSRDRREMILRFQAEAQGSNCSERSEVMAFSANQIFGRGWRSAHPHQIHMPALHATPTVAVVVAAAEAPSGPGVRRVMRNLATDFSLQQFQTAPLHLQQTANTWRPTHRFNRAQFFWSERVCLLPRKRCHLRLTCRSQEFKRPVYRSPVPGAGFRCRFRGRRKREGKETQRNRCPADRNQ